MRMAEEMAERKDVKWLAASLQLVQKFQIPIQLGKLVLRFLGSHLTTHSNFYM